MNIKKKILLVGAFPKKNNSGIYGGQLTACSLLAQSELSNKYDLQFIDSTSISIPPPNLIIRSILALKRLSKYTLKIIINKPNIIIIFVAGFSSIIEKGIMIKIGRLLNKNVMIFPRAGALISHYKKNLFLKYFIKNTFVHSNKFLCQGKYFQDFAIKELNFKEKDSPIISNWTASEIFFELGYAKNLALNKKIINLVFIGWIEKFKGIYEIIEAALILKERGKKIHIYFCGDGNGMNKLKRLVKDYNLGDMVSILGWVNQSEKIKILKYSDIFILPSWNEGLPNSMIEAMSSCLACIVTDVGSISDYIKHEENGLLIKPKSPGDLAKSIIKLIDNKILLNKISKNSFEFAMKNFTIKNAVEIFIREIESF